MKKSLNLNSNRILQLVLVSLLVYLIFSIMRSCGLLYIAYTDNYFYNFDFEKAQYVQKRIVYINAYYYFAYISGILFSLALMIAFKLKWLSSVLAIFFGFVLFRLIDSDIIRPLFGLFNNPRMNIISHLTIFLIVGLFFYFKLKKSARIKDVNVPN